MSKELNSILKNIPSATLNGEIHASKLAPEPTTQEEYDRIVAVIPRSLKNDLKDYIKKHRGETEKTVILKGLKLLGFNIPNSWLIDKRSTR